MPTAGAQPPLWVTPAAGSRSVPVPKIVARSPPPAAQTARTANLFHRVNGTILRTHLHAAATLSRDAAIVSQVERQGLAYTPITTQELEHARNNLHVLALEEDQLEAAEEALRRSEELIHGDARFLSGTEDMAGVTPHEGELEHLVRDEETLSNARSRMDDTIRLAWYRSICVLRLCVTRLEAYHGDSAPTLASMRREVQVLQTESEAKWKTVETFIAATRYKMEDTLAEVRQLVHEYEALAEKKGIKPQAIQRIRDLARLHVEEHGPEREMNLAAGGLFEQRRVQ